MFTHVHVFDVFNFELTVYPENKAYYVFTSSITGKAIERASTRELEELIAGEHPEVAIEDALAEQEEAVDPYQLFRLLLLPLENVKQNPKYHPEGDVLYHLLQVFELARVERPWDEEFLLAALLHDVGKGIDPYDHVAAGLQALHDPGQLGPCLLIGQSLDIGRRCVHSPITLALAVRKAYHLSGLGERGGHGGSTLLLGRPHVALEGLRQRERQRLLGGGELRDLVEAALSEVVDHLHDQLVGHARP